MGAERRQHPRPLRTLEAADHCCLVISTIKGWNGLDANQRPQKANGRRASPPGLGERPTNPFYPHGPLGKADKSPLTVQQKRRYCCTDDHHN